MSSSESCIASLNTPQRAEDMKAETARVERWEVVDRNGYFNGPALSADDARARAEALNEERRDRMGFPYRARCLTELRDGERIVAGAADETADLIEAIHLELDLAGVPRDGKGWALRLRELADSRLVDDEAGSGPCMGEVRSDGKPKKDSVHRATVPSSTPPAGAPGWDQLPDGMTTRWLAAISDAKQAARKDGTPNPYGALTSVEAMVWWWENVEKPRTLGVPAPSDTKAGAPTGEQWPHAETIADMLDVLKRESQSLNDYANEVTSELTQSVLRGAALRVLAARNRIAAFSVSQSHSQAGRGAAETVEGVVRHNWQFEAGRHTLNIDVYNAPDWPKGAPVTVSLSVIPAPSPKAASHEG